jgi:hypothetical protein
MSAIRSISPTEAAKLQALQQAALLSVQKTAERANAAAEKARADAIAEAVRISAKASMKAQATAMKATEQAIEKAQAAAKKEAEKVAKAMERACEKSEEAIEKAIQKTAREAERAAAKTIREEEKELVRQIRATAHGVEKEEKATAAAAADAESIEWRVMVPSKNWDQAAFETKWSQALSVQEQRFAQAKGAAKMVRCPRKDERVAFVMNGEVVMRGHVLSEGFIFGVPTVQSEAEPGSEANEIAWVQITKVGLHEKVALSGGRTWAKMPLLL